MQPIPFLDLRAQYESIKGDIDRSISDVIQNTTFILGKPVEDLESAFARYCGTRFAVGVNSGTAALHLCLAAMDIGKGDEVILPPNTFIATAEAIVHAGAAPVFCDIEENSYTIDPAMIEQKITKNTKAIIPVHLYGHPADMDAIEQIARKHGLRIIEDACQAHGARYKGTRVGNISDAAAFSFYPGKNLGAYGEGGIITTNDENVARICRLLRSHGEHPKNSHSKVGYNYRLESLQAAIVSAKLPYLDSWNKKRRDNARTYEKNLPRSCITPRTNDWCAHAFHLYVIQHERRGALRQFLSENNIATGIHYEKPIHLQEAFSYLGHKPGDFPVSEHVMQNILSLPMYPELEEEMILQVCEKIILFDKRWQQQQH